MPAESKIYVGPYLKPPIGLLPFTQFNNGLPSTITGIISKHPGFASLFIPPRELSETVRSLRKAGSSQRQIYNHFQTLLVTKTKKKK
jgi:hypothetical protein